MFLGEKVSHVSPHSAIGGVKAALATTRVEYSHSIGRQILILLAAVMLTFVLGVEGRAIFRIADGLS